MLVRYITKIIKRILLYHCFVWSKILATCIKGQFWPPLKSKTEMCVSSISSNWFIRRIIQVQYPGFYFTFTVALVTKMADEIGLK